MYTNTNVLGLVLLSSCALSSGSAFADFTISKKPTENVTCSAGVCSSSGRHAVLNVTDLTGMLASGDLILRSKKIASDIVVDAAISWTSPHRLTFDSYRSILFDKPVSVAGSPGALTITTNDGGTGGDFRFNGDGHVKIWDANSNLIINGTLYTLVHTLKGATRYLSGPFALARSIDVAGHVFSVPPFGAVSGTFEGLGNAISNLTTQGGAGLIGTLNGTVRDLHLVSVNMSGGGGAVARGSSGFIVNCTASGTVTGADNTEVGGLIGENIGVISNSASSVAVSGGNDSIVGGLIGANPQSGFEVQNYSTGSVTGGKRASVGGLIGNNIGVPHNSYALGSVTGGDKSHIGGLIGVNGTAGFGPEFVYATGAVGGTGARAGGLVGQDAKNSGISDAYWDLDTSGISDPSRGAGNIPNDPGITGLTDAQLKSGLPSGFDPSIWGQKPRINNGYPYLLANPPH